MSWVIAVLPPTSSLRASEPSWEIVNGHLVAKLDVLAGFQADGQLRVPGLADNATLWLDIGVNGLPTPYPGQGQSFRSLLERHAFYIGFEPLLDKYALGIARGVQAVKRVPLGTVELRDATRSSAIMVPLAVADLDNRMAKFHVSSVDGCSSLHSQRSREELQKGGWTKSRTASFVQAGCAGDRDAVEMRMVPTVTLKVVLQDWLGGREVEFMHIDVQGAELSVLRSARDRLQQVHRILLEVPAPSCATLTEGAPSCSEVFDALRTLGFEPEDGIPAKNTKGIGLLRGFSCTDVPWETWNSQCEFDVLFVRRDIRNRFEDVVQRYDKYRAPVAGRD